MNCVLRSSFTASKVRPSTLVWRCTLALRLPRGVSPRHSQSCRPFLRSFAATLLDDRAAHLGHCRRYRARPGCSWSLRCRRAVAIASRGGDEHVHDCRGAHEALAVYVTLCLSSARSSAAQLQSLTGDRTGCLSACERSGGARRYLASRLDQCHHVR